MSKAPSNSGRKKPFAGLRSLGGLRQGSPPIAIDFGVDSLKLLQLGAGDPPSLVAAATLHTPENLLYDQVKRLRWQMEQLPGLVRKAKFKTTRAVCAIPTGLLFCKHLQFQRADGVPLADLVHGSLPRELGCLPEELLMRHIEVGELSRSGRTEVICFAAGQESVARLMHAIKAAKLEPVGIHNEFTAILPAFGHTPGQAKEGDEATLYLDLGRGTTKILAARGGKMLFARTIHFGGLQLDEAVVRQLKCSMSQAIQERLALDAIVPGETPAPVNADPHDDADPEAAPSVEAQQAEPTPARPEPASPAAATMSRVSRRIDLSEQVEILVDEISMCLRYIRSTLPDERIQKIVFLGGESRHRALCAEIARQVRLPAQCGDPLTRIGRSGSEPTVDVDLREPQPGWAVAMGMCLSPTDL